MKPPEQKAAGTDASRQKNPVSSPAPKKPSIVKTAGKVAGSKAASLLKRAGRFVGDHAGALLGSSAAAGRIDQRIAYGDMMDRWRRWSARGNTPATGRNVLAFIQQTYGPNAYQIALKAFNAAGITDPAPQQGTPSQTQQAPAQGQPEQTAPQAAGQSVTQASVNQFANAAYAMLDQENVQPNDLIQALQNLRSHTDSSSDKTLTAKVAQRFRDGLARNPQAAQRYRAVNGDKLLGLSEGRDAARKLLSRPINERRIIVARVHNLLESEKKSSTEAGRIASDLRLRIASGLTLRESWSSLLMEANGATLDDVIDNKVLQPLMKQLAGTLAQVGIIKVNNMYRDSLDRRTEVTNIDGAQGGTSYGDDGDYRPAQKRGSSQPPSPTSSDQPEDNRTEVEKRGMPGQEINQKGVDRALAGMGLGKSQYAYYIAQVAAGHDATNYDYFRSIMNSYIPQDDPVLQELKKDPYKLAFMVAKALRP